MNTRSSYRSMVRQIFYVEGVNTIGHIGEGVSEGVLGVDPIDTVILMQYNYIPLPPRP